MRGIDPSGHERPLWPIPPADPSVSLPADTPTSARYLFPTPSSKANPNHVTDAPPTSTHGMRPASPFPQAGMPPPGVYDHHGMRPPPGAFDHHGMPPPGAYDHHGMRPPPGAYDHHGMPPPGAYDHHGMRPPPGAYDHYGMPPPGAFEHYGMPPLGAYDHYGMPPPGAFEHYGMPPPGGYDHYGMRPPPGVYDHPGMPPPGAFDHYGMPPPGAYGHPGMPPPSPYGHPGMPPPSPYGHPGMPPPVGYGQPMNNFGPEPLPGLYRPQYPLMPGQNLWSNMLLTSGFGNEKHGGDKREGNDVPVGAPPSSEGLVDEDFRTASIQLQLTEQLTESNYETWRPQIDIVLGHLEYDVALLEPKPDEPAHTASDSVKANYRKWNKANHMCVLIIRGSLSAKIKGELPETDSAKELMNNIQTHFKMATKRSIETMICQLCTLKFDGQGSVREHVLRMENLACKIRDLKVEISDVFLVHMVLNSLPTDFNPVKDSYYSTEEKWDVNELLKHCLEEEAKHGHEKVHSSPMETSGSKSLDVTEKRNAGQMENKTNHEDEKITPGAKSSSTTNTTNPQKIGTCNNCGEVGHIQTSCTKPRKEKRSRQQLVQA